jgi:mannitol-1-/sugar-/sorbitol-6-/2-deoxyglucose-6-phosphatase
MQLTTVIFDMDGLLIDSEPLWQQAAYEVFKQYGVSFTQQQYNTSVGLRTREFVAYWFQYFQLDEQYLAQAEKDILTVVGMLIERNGNIMPGVPQIFEFFKQRNFKIGIATSSPQTLIDIVVRKANLSSYLHATSSAEDMENGKPHPQVYLDCAAKLNSAPLQCVCFEDSFNGMIAAKAARMKCVVVPHGSMQKEERWAAADLKLSSLQNFGQLHFGLLNQS